jgi:hypothetical protein
MMRSAHEDAKREPGPDGGIQSFHAWLIKASKTTAAATAAGLPVFRRVTGCPCWSRDQWTATGQAQTSGPQLDKRRRVDRN